eukprot:339161-Amphidinium_carterae.2
MGVTRTQGLRPPASTSANTFTLWINSWLNLCLQSLARVEFGYHSPIHVENFNMSFAISNYKELFPKHAPKSFKGP